MACRQCGVDRGSHRSTRMARVEPHRIDARRRARGRASFRSSRGGLAPRHLPSGCAHSSTPAHMSARHSAPWHPAWAASSRRHIVRRPVAMPCCQRDLARFSLRTAARTSPCPSIRVVAASLDDAATTDDVSGAFSWGEHDALFGASNRPAGPCRESAFGAESRDRAPGPARPRAHGQDRQTPVRVTSSQLSLSFSHSQLFQNRAHDACMMRKALTTVGASHHSLVTARAAQTSSKRRATNAPVGFCCHFANRRRSSRFFVSSFAHFPFPPLLIAMLACSFHRIVIFCSSAWVDSHSRHRCPHLAGGSPRKHVRHNAVCRVVRARRRWPRRRGPQRPRRPLRRVCAPACGRVYLHVAARRRRPRPHLGILHPGDRGLGRAHRGAYRSTGSRQLLLGRPHR